MEPGTPYAGHTGLLRPPAEATGLSAIRVLKNGSARQFTGVEFDRGWPAVEHFIRTLRAVGYIKPSKSEPCYAVLDVLDAAGDIIGEYDVPHARAFQFIYRKLGLRLEPDTTN